MRSIGDMLTAAKLACISILLPKEVYPDVVMSLTDAVL
jgi:hypothetical protein